jgi:hypothetical protein
MDIASQGIAFLELNNTQIRTIRLYSPSIAPSSAGIMGAFVNHLFELRGGLWFV